MNVLAHRPAPVQAHFLGYSITTGADYVDYLITDEVYVPPEWQEYCSEKTVYLPDTFMATTRQEAETLDLRRAHFDLPEDGMVFANFNHPCKFEPKIFGAWMRILDAVPDSVMWFGAWTPATQRNLKREAEKRGVDPDRLVFSEIVDRPVHLARLALADLALDNLYHGGGVTTVDALWVGLPVLTIRGDTPGARLGATLTKAAGLPEAVVEDLETYVTTAIALAHDPGRLLSWKHRLQENRDACPLFDLDRFRTNLERAIVAMWRNFEDGKAPRAIAIAGANQPAANIQART
jgi:predicted O-linked N-acetylglucosamine transferase (SPINDLY family)